MQVRCLKCGRVVAVADGMAGQVVRCGACLAPIQTPAEVSPGVVDGLRPLSKYVVPDLQELLRLHEEADLFVPVRTPVGRSLGIGCLAGAAAFVVCIGAALQCEAADRNGPAGSAWLWMLVWVIPLLAMGGGIWLTQRGSDLRDTQRHEMALMKFRAAALDMAEKYPAMLTIAGSPDALQDRGWLQILIELAELPATPPSSPPPGAPPTTPPALPSDRPNP